MAEGRIEFQHVWKKFRRGEVHDSLRDLVPALVSRLFRRGPGEELRAREFWAVEDVSFSVRPGEALGIIGPNGAGKSTILKLLTGILRPTHGRCGVRGRIGALIETSAGFHPDLTGGENIFLQGAIMGMTRREIAARFDDIVAFSELEEFIDTPVKRYSSGMNARLGFAIAAHMSPDVLIVDEVLAVGDYRFQRKAFDHIGGMIRRQLPVVIVSHQLDRIASLCTHCVLLDRGRIVAQGAPDACIARYVMSALGADDGRNPDLPFKLASLEMEPQTVRSGEWITIRLRGEVPPNPSSSHHWGVRVRALHNAQPVFAVNVTQWEPRLCRPGPFEAVVTLQANTGTGYFAVETPIWDSSMDYREVGQGPRALFRVEGASFRGTVNLHASVEVVEQKVPPAVATG